MNVALETSDTIWGYTSGRVLYVRGSMMCGAVLLQQRQDKTIITHTQKDPVNRSVKGEGEGERETFL